MKSSPILLSTAVFCAAVMASSLRCKAESVAEVLSQSPKAEEATVKSPDPMFNMHDMRLLAPKVVNEMQVKAYPSQAGSDGVKQWLIAPIPLVNQEELRDQLVKLKASLTPEKMEASRGKQFGLTFTVTLMHEAIRGEVAQVLTELHTNASGSNARPVTVNEVAITPPVAIQLFATHGESPVSLWAQPSPVRLGKSNISSSISNLDTHPMVTLADTLENLEAFVERPQLEVVVMASGYSVRRNSITVALDKVLNSSARSHLLGDDQLENKLIQRSESSGGGVGLSLGGLGSIGGGSKSSENTTERVVKRWVSRDRVAKAVSEWGQNLVVTEWTEIDKSIQELQSEASAKARQNIIDLLIRFVLAENQSAWFSFNREADNSYQLRNDIYGSASVTIGKPEKWDASQKPTMAVDTSKQVGAEFAGYKFSEANSFKFNANDEAHFVSDGSGLTPTAVKLYLLDENVLKARLRATYETNQANQAEFELKSTSPNGVGIVDGLVNGGQELQVASIATLERAVRDLLASTPMFDKPERVTHGIDPVGQGHARDSVFDLMDQKDGIAVLAGVAGVFGNWHHGAVVYVDQGRWKLRLTHLSASSGKSASVDLYRYRKGKTP